MKTFDLTLGGQPVQVHAAGLGQFDRSTFDALFPTGQLYGLDVESTFMTDLGQFDPDFRVKTVQFGTKQYGWVLRLDDPAQRDAAAALLSDAGTVFCSHTNMDVLSVHAALSVDISARNVDTHVLASMAYTGDKDGRDLKSLVSKLIGPELAAADAELDALFHLLWTGKRNAKKVDVEAHGWNTISEDDETYLKYAGLDAVAARQLVELLVPLTHASERLLEIEMWLAGQANRIQTAGMLVDQVMLKELTDEANTVSAEAEQVISRLTVAHPPVGCTSWDRQTAKKQAEGLSPRSPLMLPHQVNRQVNGKVVYKKDNEHRTTCKGDCLGCKTFVKDDCCQGWLAQHGADWALWEAHTGDLTPTGTPSLKKENAKLLMKFEMDEVGSEVREALLKHKAFQDRVLKTKAIAEHLGPDGRIHPKLLTVGASSTARMSSTGPNMQNFSKDDPRVRGCFVPRQGHVLVSCDFSQVELRVAAALAGETKMIDAIKAGDDLHTLTAQAIGRPRPIGKMANFLTVYGGGGRALASQARIPRADADESVAKFRQAYPEITRLTNAMSQFRQHITTITGRRLDVKVWPNGEVAAYANINYLIQSSSRDLLVDAWYRFATVYGRADMLWLPVHDELVLEVPEELLDVVLEEVKECMSFEFLGVPIECEANVLRDENGVSRWGK